MGEAIIICRSYNEELKLLVKGMRSLRDFSNLGVKGGFWFVV